MTSREQAYQALKEAVGPKGWSEDPERLRPHVTEWRDRWHGRTPMLLMPSDTGTVARIVQICSDAQIALVPQGGNTGLMGGGVPDDSGNEVLISMKRMNRIREVDTASYSMTAEAGVTVADLQQAAADADRLFPLSLASEGSCTAGGVISTNAGGVHVLRYGNTRDLVLGLEAVLPDGRIWDGLTALRKDNTGYDIKNLLVGAEGTLGVVTAATFKLFPAIRARELALCGLNSAEDAITLFARMREQAGDILNAFELMPRIVIDFVTRHLDGHRDPLRDTHQWYALIEVADSRRNSGLRDQFESVLSDFIEDGLVADAIIAESINQQRALWKIREEISEAEKFEGGNIKHDISVAVARIPEFIRRADDAVTGLVQGARPIAFGHVGDGNVHYNVAQPPDGDRSAFMRREADISAAVHDIVCDMGGSISAEHGIGRMKVKELARTKSPVALDAMAAIKAALDPVGIMNPGRILASGRTEARHTKTED